MTTPRKGRIFISYRRADSAGYAVWIYDRIEAHFGEDSVFMDVETIEAGVDFVKVLQNAVQSCDVLIALIGQQWLNIEDEAGNRRLDNPKDFVRIEIAAALERDIRVIPVLVDGASMPREAELPDDLNQLVNRNALQVNLHSYNSGAKRMISQLELALRKAEEKRKQEAITKAAWEKEEREHKEREERAQRENEAREKTEAEERARFAAEQKAKKEREDRERRESEEKARKEKEAHKKAEAEKRARLAAKRKWLSLGIFLFICLLFEGIYLFQIWPITTVTATPLPTNLPPSNPSIGSTWLQTKDGSTMVYVPAGEFQMGSETGEEDEKPVHTVNLDAFWIDQTEVTNKMFTSFLNAKGNQSDGGEMVGLRRR